MGIENLEGGKKPPISTQTQSILENINSLGKRINQFKNENLFTSYLDEETRNKISSDLSDIKGKIDAFNRNKEGTLETSLLMINEQFPQIESDLETKMNRWTDLIKMNKDSYNYHKQIIKTIKNTRRELSRCDGSTKNNFIKYQNDIKRNINQEFPKIPNNSFDKKYPPNESIQSALIRSIDMHFESKIEGLLHDSLGIGGALKDQMNQMISNLNRRNDALKEYIKELNKPYNENGVEFRITLLILLLQRSVSKKSFIPFNRSTIIDDLNEIRNRDAKNEQKISMIDRLFDIEGKIYKMMSKMDDQTRFSITTIISKIWPLSYPNSGTTTLLDTKERTDTDWYKKQIGIDVIDEIFNSYQISKQEKAK